MEELEAKWQKTNFTVFVNSCDAFEDCWLPFFLLLRKYWPNLDAPILLNTETKSWSFDGFSLNCTQVQLGAERRLSWSECLFNGLAQVKTPLVLYFQEDYFIKSPVDIRLIEKASKYLDEHPEVQRIALTNYCGPGPFEEHSEAWLMGVSQNARYRISTQASLWRVDNLRSYLKAVENGWMFEIFGTWRARRRKDIFLVAISTDRPNEPSIDYLHTGIIKGQWHTGMQKVFFDNDIDVDFSVRGIHIPQKGLKRKIAVMRKLVENLPHAIREIFNRFGF